MVTRTHLNVTLYVPITPALTYITLPCIDLLLRSLRPDHLVSYSDFKHPRLSFTLQVRACFHCFLNFPVMIVTILATGWTVRGSNSSRGEIFRTCPDRARCPPSLMYNGYRVFPGGKERPGRDADPSPSYSAVGHKRVELYLYSPCGPYGLYRASVPVQ
jgi:hypothetical protein